LIQTRKISRVPIVLYGSEYWGGLLDWIKGTMLEREKNINAKDLDLFHLTDDVEKAIKVINDFYSDTDHQLKPNF